MSYIQRIFGVLFALAIFAASPAAAQGLQTGIISGTVTTSDRASLPGDAECLAAHLRRR